MNKTHEMFTEVEIIDLLDDEIEAVAGGNCGSGTLLSALGDLGGAVLSGSVGGIVSGLGGVACEVGERL